MNGIIKKLSSCLLISIVTITTARAQIKAKVKTLSGDSVSISKLMPNKAIVFLYNSPSCTACKKNLGKYLQANIDTNNITIYAVARLLFTPATYWTTESELKSLCPKIKEVYFDNTTTTDLDTFNTNTDGLFGEFKIKHAPALLLINKNKVQLLTYAAIFSGYALSTEAIKTIEQFFN